LTLRTGFWPLSPDYANYCQLRISAIISNMLSLKWFRLVIGSVGLLVWLALYVAARFGRRDLRRWRAPLLVLALALVPAWIGFLITDHDHIASALQGNWLGLMCASNWLALHYRVTPPTTITTLGLSDSQNATTRSDASDQLAQQAPHV
jgi:hypothetical protein